jgi:hypothetical protein
VSGLAAPFLRNRHIEHTIDPDAAVFVVRGRSLKGADTN